MDLFDLSAGSQEACLLAVQPAGAYRLLASATHPNKISAPSNPYLGTPFPLQQHALDTHTAMHIYGANSVETRLSLHLLVPQLTPESFWHSTYYPPNLPQKASTGDHLQAWRPMSRLQEHWAGSQNA